ncbi:MAG TPA: glutathione S-transferase family protein, partial [Pseudomonadales bacterium]
LIFRKLKQLEDMIPVSAVEPEMLDQGWQFARRDGASSEPLYGFDYLHQLYTLADPQVTTQVTVPLLWDKQQQTVVNNESAEIIRMFNQAFNQLSGNTDDYYPPALRQDIDAINRFVYDNINNGVYRCGFATSQQAYEKAFHRLFQALDEVEQRLQRQRYLVGDRLTEADWRLFTTLLRFDAVYVGHFKCNLRRIADYPNLYNYLKELYQVPGIADTVHFDHIKQHYYYSHTSINPTQIVPLGPEIKLDEPHDRERL